MKTAFREKIIISILIIIGLTISNPSFSQEPVNFSDHQKSPLREKLFYGGSLGLQFGSITMIDVSPLIGYKISPKVGIGVSPTYRYYGYKNYYADNSDLRTNIFGASIFSRVIIYQNFFAHAEYEYLTYKTKDPLYSSMTMNKSFQSVLVGGGYREPISENAYMYLLVLWNLNETIDSPYTNPIIRAGFSIGF